MPEILSTLVKISKYIVKILSPGGFLFTWTRIQVFHQFRLFFFHILRIQRKTKISIFESILVEAISQKRGRAYGLII